MRGLPLLIPLAALLLGPGCGSTDARGDRPDEGLEFRPEVAPLTSSSAAPDEVAAREHLTAGRYDEAHDAFSRLATYESDPARRAEFLFFAAEAALGAGEHEDAYDTYRKLLRRFPSTPRYPLVVERIFLIGRLYAEGRAKTTTWFFGMEMSDRSLGVEILEEFQRARERHPLADDALHAIALARIAQEEYGLAIDAWQKLIDEYPRSEWAETAEFRIATTYVLMSDGTAYDKRPLLTALQRLRRYIERHPTGNHVAEAREEVARLEEGIAAHKVEVARFYLQRDRRYSAALCLEEVLRDYPRTDAAQAAARLKAGLTGVKPPEPKQHQEDEDDGPRPANRRPPPPDLPPGMFPQPVD
ncbi:MAG: outer membrane protein assembly factor BamD [Planctomycetes bacterium]|nr:outer membrane protein assembly factor BamD [Planctomycetota bacterium]